MKRRVFKLRSRLEGEHIKETIFVGNEGETLANIGTLAMHTGEWQLFGALLKLGSEATYATRRDTVVVLEGDDEVIKGLEEQEK